MFSQGAWAVVFNVTNESELRAALTTAASNGGDDEILLAPGTYFGSFKYVSEEDFALKIASESESDSAIIDAQKRNFGFYIEGNKTRTNIELTNLVIRNAFSAGEGGGLLARSLYGSLFLDRIVLELNTAKEGGGLYAENIGKLILNRSILRNNLAASFNPDGSIGAMGYGGGASLLNLAEIDIGSSIFEENQGIVALTIDNYGPGVPYIPNAGIIVRGSEFLLNDAKTLFLRAAYHTEVRIEENYFAKNEGGDGEVIYMYITSSSVNLTSNVFVDNVCRSVALDIILNSYTSAHELLVEKNTFANDSDCKWFNVQTTSDQLNLRAMIRSNLFQGSVLNFLSTDPSFEMLSLLNNSFVGFAEPSQASFGSDLEMTVANNIFYSPVYETGFELRGVLKKGTLRNNIFQKVTGYWDVDEGNQTVDPKFHDPENGDFRLSADSPALDAGTNEAVTDLDATDLDGNPRILNGTVDIGAYERNTAPLHPADTNEDSIITLDEFNAYNTAWRANDTWPTPPNEIPIDYVTRAGYLLQKGGEYKNIGVGKPLTWVPVSQ